MTPEEYAERCKQCEHIRGLHIPYCCRVTNLRLYNTRTTEGQCRCDGFVEDIHAHMNDLGMVNVEVSKKSAPIKVGDYIIGYKNGKIHSWKPKKSKKKR